MFNTLSSARLRTAAAAACLMLSTAAAAQPAPGVEWKSGGLAVRASVDAQAWYYGMRGTWWNLAAASAPTFDTDRSFVETWLHPKLTGTYALGDAGQGYGGISVGLTQNLSSDAFDYDGEGAVRFETAFAGLRRSTAGGWKYDVSLGRQPFTLGTGMLLTAGSSNGYGWGGAASAPRKAWSRTAIGRLSHGEFTGQAFMLEPSEAAEARTDTRVHGVSVEWARPQMGKAGLAWIGVPRSDAIYPGDLAPLAYIEGGREGLDTWHGWFDITGVVPGVPTLGFRGEFARQRNQITRVGGQRDPMRASAWLLGASWWAQQWWFAPRFSMHVARFSGNKPGTDTFERFDPMFWGNGLDNWWFGANGAYAWLNSNVRAQRFIVDAYASQRDIIQFQYVRTSADQLNSAIQYGQGVRFGSDGLLLGVPRKHLSDELYLQYARVVSPTVVVIGFVSRNSPGEGLEATTTERLRAWTTLGIGVTASF